MKTSRTGRDAISASEGVRLRSYLDSGGIWTIGRGMTEGVTEGMVITPNQEEVMFAKTLVQYEQAVTRLVTVPLTQSQYDSLVSLVYNIGIGAFGKSTLLRLLNIVDYSGAADQFLRWDMDNGKHIPGLLKRRERERTMFLRGILPDTPIAPDLVIAEPKLSFLALTIQFLASLFKKP